MKLTTENQGMVGIGLAALSLLLQFGKAPEPKDSQKELMGLATQAIQSARGTEVCISFNCGGSRRVDVPQSQTPSLVYYQVDPRGSYVDPNGQPLEVVQFRDGKHYVAVAAQN